MVLPSNGQRSLAEAPSKFGEQVAGGFAWGRARARSGCRARARLAGAARRKLPGDGRAGAQRAGGGSRWRAGSHLAANRLDDPHESPLVVDVCWARLCLRAHTAAHDKSGTRPPVCAACPSNRKWAVAVPLRAHGSLGTNLGGDHFSRTFARRAAENPIIWSVRPPDGRSV